MRPTAGHATHPGRSRPQADCQYSPASRRSTGDPEAHTSPGAHADRERIPDSAEDPQQAI